MFAYHDTGFTTWDRQTTTVPPKDFVGEFGEVFAISVAQTHSMEFSFLPSGCSARKSD